MIETHTQFTDRSVEFLAKNAVMTDTLMGLMAAGIEIQIKTSGKTPFRKGNLRSSARHRKVRVGSYVVEDTALYAAAQEAGTTRGFPMTNYTTPGTGKGYFRKAINTIKDRSAEYIQTAKGAAGLGEF